MSSNVIAIDDLKSLLCALGWYHEPSADTVVTFEYWTNGISSADRDSELVPRVAWVSEEYYEKIKRKVQKRPGKYPSKC